MKRPFFYDPYDNTVLYLGWNPFIRLLMRIIGYRLSDLGWNMHEIKVYRVFRNFVRTEFFNRVLMFFGAELVLDGWR